MMDKEERGLLALAIAALNLVISALQLRETKKSEKKNRSRRKRKR